MIITHGNQTIDLFGVDDFPSGPPERIFMGVSGGLDSASLLYLICTHFPDIEVFPYGGNDANHPMDYLNAMNVVQWFQERFPNVKIHDSYIFNFDADQEPWTSKAEELIESGERPGFATVRGVAKTLVMNHMIRTHMEENFPDIVRVSGMTANPPDDVMHEGEFYHKAERRRDQGQKRPELVGRVYQPYTNVDKKFVAGVFNDYDLMEDLFPLTGSCVGTPKSQGYGLHGCGQCFWCNEKEWAFGSY